MINYSTFDGVIVHLNQIVAPILDTSFYVVSVWRP